MAYELSYRLIENEKTTNWNLYDDQLKVKHRQIEIYGRAKSIKFSGTLSKTLSVEMGREWLNDFTVSKTAMSAIHGFSRIADVRKQHPILSDGRHSV